jgi:serine/threonine protein kinase
MPLSVGQTFAGYRILRLLGSGGWASFTWPTIPRLPRQDALKVLRADVSADTDYRARFNREAYLASTLWHPNIVGGHDRGEEDGQLWISMDFVDGLDAARLLATDIRLERGRGSCSHRHGSRQRAGLRPQARPAAPRRQARQHHVDASQ